MSLGATKVRFSSFSKLRPEKSVVGSVQQAVPYFDELDHRHLVDECRGRI
jgi:hypothetical protein